MTKKIKKSNNNKLTIIIVNYNSTKLLNALLYSLKKIRNIVGEILIIDNNSSDFKKLITKNKKIKIIKNDKNFGFSKAVNQGIVISKHKHILLLNPDSELIDNSIIKLFEKIKKNPQIGPIGEKILKKNDKSTQLSTTTKPNFGTALFEFTNLKKVFPNNTFSKHFWVEKRIKNKKPIEVDSLCGAFILFRKIFNKKTTLFDENFFLYMEDIDFGLNLKKSGAKIIFDPRTTIEHIGGTSNNNKYHTILKHWYQSRSYFFQKHLSKIEGKILSIILYAEEKPLYVYHYLKNEPAE